MAENQDANGPPSKKQKSADDFDLLDQISKNISNTARERTVHVQQTFSTNIDPISEQMSQIKSKKTNIAETCANHLLQSFEGVRRVLANAPVNPNRKIEIEVRFGLISGEAFRAGIRKDDYDAFLRVMEQDSHFTCDFIEESDYLYEKIQGRTLNPGENYRITFDEESKKCISAQIKTRMSNFELDLNPLVYDCRISISTEEVMEPPKVLPDGWKLKREKKRYSYVSSFPWKIDFTEVTSVDPREIKNTTWELEFEFLDGFVQHFDLAQKEHNKEQILNHLNNFWKVINAIFKKLGASDHSQLFTGLHLEKVTDPQELVSLRRAIVATIPGMDAEQYVPSFIPGSNPLTPEFPGSMPVNFSRRYLPILQQKRYYVSEKTDGIRYLLFVSKSLDGVYFVDRKFDFYFIQGYEVLLEVFATQGDTVLDGEIVRFVKMNNAMFLVFDILMYNGTPCGAEVLSKRMEKIGKAIKDFRDSPVIADMPMKPFSIEGKPMQPLNHFRSVTSKISESAGERYYIDARRHHKTDGLIFTPDEPYASRTVHNLFKWKYLDKLTIDLKVAFHHKKQTLTYFCSVDSVNELEYPINLKPEDAVRVQRDWNRITEQQVLIVEVSYDPWKGVWIYHNKRTDKLRPNHIRIVLETLEAISENVQLDELIYRLSDPQHDDWRAKMEFHIKNTVKEQEHRLAKHGAHPPSHGLPPSSHHPQPHPLSRAPSVPSSQPSTYHYSDNNNNQGYNPSSTSSERMNINNMLNS